MNIFEIESEKKKKTEEKSDSDVHEGLLHCLINNTSTSTVATYLYGGIDCVIPGVEISNSFSLVLLKVSDYCNVNSV